MYLIGIIIYSVIVFFVGAMYEDKQIEKEILECNSPELTIEIKRELVAGLRRPFGL